jgi:hypothetical protein
VSGDEEAAGMSSPSLSAPVAVHRLGLLGSTGASLVTAVSLLIVDLPVDIYSARISNAVTCGSLASGNWWSRDAPCYSTYAIVRLFVLQLLVAGLLIAWVALRRSPSRRHVVITGILLGLGAVMFVVEFPTAASGRHYQPVFGAVDLLVGALASGQASYLLWKWHATRSSVPLAGA